MLSPRSDSEISVQTPKPKLIKKPESPKKEVVKLPQIPDESKWDIVYVLPFFAKPGKHTYMIKYKNTEDKQQQALIQ